MHILLVDNSKPDIRFFTPLLFSSLEEYGHAVRVCKTRAEVLASLSERAWDAVVLSGSSMNLSEEVRVTTISKDLMVMLNLTSTPILGICFGMQLMAIAYGGHVKRMATPVQADQFVDPDSTGVLAKKGEGFAACFSHGDCVAEVPPGFRVLATNPGGEGVAIMESRDRIRFGVQFHPERSPDSRVLEYFLNFVSRGDPQPPVQYPKDTTPRYEDIEGVQVPWNTVRRIETLMGRAHFRKVADEFGLDEDTVWEIWTRFRNRWGIPAMLL